MSFNSFGSFSNSDGLIQKPQPSTEQMLTTNVKPTQSQIGNVVVQIVTA